jgi:hypothetical protein
MAGMSFLSFTATCVTYVCMYVCRQREYLGECKTVAQRMQLGIQPCSHAAGAGRHPTRRFTMETPLHGFARCGPADAGLIGAQAVLVGGDPVLVTLCFCVPICVCSQCLRRKSCCLPGSGHCLTVLVLQYLYWGSGGGPQC